MDETGDSAHCDLMKARDLRFAGLLMLGATLAGCVPASVPPASVPPPATAPAARPAALTPPTARFDNWIDAPQTPGTWRYSAQGARTEAVFSGRENLPLMRLRCEREAGSVVLSLPESSVQRPAVTIRTPTLTRTLEGAPADRETLVALDPRDPLLDAMIFARGRFAVEAIGMAPLYLPSWAEVARVTEDCR
jgi:hypothetical protein